MQRDAQVAARGRVGALAHERGEFARALAQAGDALVAAAAAVRVARADAVAERERGALALATLAPDYSYALAAATERAARVDADVIIDPVELGI